MKSFRLPQSGDHYIGGQWQASQNKQIFENLSPHDNKLLNKIALGGKAEVDTAVDAARKAYGTWSKTTWAERSRIVKQIASVILANLENFAALEAIDTGKPYAETSTGDIPRAAANLNFYAGLEESILSKKFASEDGSQHFTSREAIGVVGLITPWNFPLHLLTWKLGPALMCGNAVIMKPAELTPLSASFLCELLEKTDLPKGVVNLVHGFGPDSAGQALVEHPDVKAISFTGETSTGSAIMRSASPWLKKLSFELGGKGASVVFADANLKKAAEISERAAFRNQGQVCLAGSRLLVDKKIAASFIDLLLQQVKQSKMGHPLDPSTTMGSLISIAHRDRVKSYVDLAVKEKSEVLIGGRIPEKFATGAYFEPTVLTHVSQDSRLIQEEIFGPVLTIQTFEDFEEAMALLNGTKYGLSCSVWSEDPKTLQLATENARTGMVWQNCWNVRNLNSAFGGMKQSGVGREGGEYSIEFFSELKTFVKN